MWQRWQNRYSPLRKLKSLIKIYTQAGKHSPLPTNQASKDECLHPESGEANEKKTLPEEKFAFGAHFNPVLLSVCVRLFLIFFDNIFFLLMLQYGSISPSGHEWGEEVPFNEDKATVECGCGWSRLVGCGYHDCTSLEWR